MDRILRSQCVGRIWYWSVLVLVRSHTGDGTGLYTHKARYKTIPYKSRHENRCRLTASDLDLLVVDGGISGASVASELTQCATHMRPDSGICYPFGY